MRVMPVRDRTIDRKEPIRPEATMPLVPAISPVNEPLFAGSSSGM